jgi:hypothetical protein
LDYHARVRLCVATLIVLAAATFSSRAARPQEGAAWEKTQRATSEPEYDDTFSGSIIELSPGKVTVSRSILGKPAEKRTFSLRPDTRVEGKLRLKAKVTVGFVTADEVDIARLVVVRSTQRSAQDKK